jgi:hypothetical protein
VLRDAAEGVTAGKTPLRHIGAYDMSNVPTTNELLAIIAKLQADLAAKQNVTLTVKLGEAKGNISVYGLQRFPVTFYANQWERLLASDVVAKILGCIKENEAKLNRKGREFVAPVA